MFADDFEFEIISRAVARLAINSNCVREKFAAAARRALNALRNEVMVFLLLELLALPSLRSLH